MDIKEALDMLRAGRSGVQQWNSLRADAHSTPDLSGANLSRCDLSGVDLHSVCFAGAFFGGSELDHANLSNATLCHADMPACNLSYANLTGANLIGADLVGVRFDEETVLPDGTIWTRGTDMAHFTLRERTFLRRPYFLNMPVYRRR